jgi:hypothetical protein
MGGRIMDTTIKEMKNSYSKKGWEGVNHKRNLDISEIGKEIKKELKNLYPTAKFSIRISRYSMGQSLYICLKEWDEKVFTGEETEAQLNPYYIEKDERLTDKGKEIMLKTQELANSFNFNDSDSQTDYFHRGFYDNYQIGTYEKPFKRRKK